MDGYLHIHQFLFKKKFLKKLINHNENYYISSDYDFIIRSFKNKRIKKFFLNHHITKMLIGEWRAQKYYKYF